MRREYEEKIFELIAPLWKEAREKNESYDFCQGFLDMAQKLLTYDNCMQEMFSDKITTPPLTLRVPRVVKL